jgi:S1-C subfamily serine protease
VHQDVTPALAALHGLPVSHGAFITEVAPETPAQEAGLLEGDIIVQMGDVQLSLDMLFLNALARLEPDETAPFVVNRGGREITLDVHLGHR